MQNLRARFISASLLLVLSSPLATDTTDTTFEVIDYQIEQFDDMDTQFYLQEILKAFQIDSL